MHGALHHFTGSAGGVPKGLLECVCIHLRADLGLLGLGRAGDQAAADGLTVELFLQRREDAALGGLLHEGAGLRGNAGRGRAARVRRAGCHLLGLDRLSLKLDMQLARLGLALRVCFTDNRRIRAIVRH